MKLVVLVTFLVHLSTTAAQDGRKCDFTDNNYVSWTDCSSAIINWCNAHDGELVPFKGSIDNGTINGYKSGKWNVGLYVKYQNDHAQPGWPIENESCNWYLSYIAQGCTKGGDRPSDPNKQFADGGTFYEPKMGSVDFKWQYTK